MAKTKIAAVRYTAAILKTILSVIHFLNYNRYNPKSKELIQVIGGEFV